MRITVLLQHYHTPDCATAARPWSLVRALAARHDVTVLTTDAWREHRVTRDFDWCPDSATMHMLPVPYANEMTARQRLRSYLTYAAKVVAQGLRAARPDLIYASSTPLTAAAAGAALAARWRCPWIFEVRDLWPDFPAQMGALDGRPLLRRALYGLEKVLYRNADRVLAASPDMAAHVRQFTRPHKVSSVEYGTDLEILSQVKETDVSALRGALGLGGRPVVLYAGSFGRANDLPTLVEVARRLQRHSSARFVFAGRGYHRPLLERAARRLPNVRLLDPQPYPKALALFRLADLSLVSFLDRPVLAANAPSKFFDSLAAGTPVIVTNPGWTKAFVERHRCGWYTPAEQPDALARRVEAVLNNDERRRTAAANARHAAQEHFDRALHMRKILSIIEEMTPSGK